MSLQTRPKRSSCPAPEVWEAELNTHEPDARLLDHLEHCDQCRALIERLAGDANWWREASDTLAMPVVDLSHLTETICPLSAERSDAAPTDPLCRHEIEQLQAMLPTASHPELLARIGRYELEQLIGRGGMGLVFRARDTELHRVVAVKTLAMYLLPMGTARERFIREGRAAALLSHPHIVPMYDVITDPPVPALVMQYIAGPTLESWIEQHGPMGWQDALRIGAQLADALSAAHAEGLVHRDIKPSNVLLEADGARASLTDFGLVRAIDDATLTHSGMLAGTPHFMSPEQARGEEVDGRSDLFSLGSLLYFAMAGHPPFRGRESMAVLHGLCHSPHIPLGKLNREIPLEVSRLVDRLLAKQVSRRPGSSREVRDEMRTLSNASRRLRSVKASSINRWCALAAGLACVLIAAALGWRAWPEAMRGGQRSVAHSVAQPTRSGSLGSSKVAQPAAETYTNSAAASEGDHREFIEFEMLAREARELESQLDALQAASRSEVRSLLLPAFDEPARQAASLEAELDKWEAVQRAAAEF